MGDKEDVEDDDLVDAPRNAEARLAQEKLWAATNVDARQHLHAREAASSYRERLQTAIGWFYVLELLINMQQMDGANNLLAKLSPELLTKVVSFALPGQGPLVYALLDAQETPASGLPALAAASFRVMIRKRPLLQRELDEKEYDVVRCGFKLKKDLSLPPSSAMQYATAPTSTPAHAPETVMCHEGTLARTGKRLSMRHVYYEFDRVLDENTPNARVCEEAVQPLVAHAFRGQAATMLCYGQTGTGKTYTLMAALHYVFAQVEKQAVDVELTFFEIHGKHCYDLLNARKRVRLLSDAQEVVHTRGAKTVELKRPTAAELAAVTKEALELRTIEVTERNPISSRSHAVCALRFLNGAGGTLRLVDLAGSERNYETMKMTAVQHKESADINTSLMALKHCIRAHQALRSGETHVQHTIVEKRRTLRSKVGTKEKDTSSSRGVGSKEEEEETESVRDIKRKTFRTPVRAPYRAHMLTRVLRDCFVSEDHLSIIIATVSPTPTDLSHTLNTCDHMLLTGDADRRKWERAVDIPMVDALPFTGKAVHKWTSEEVRMWLNVVEGGRFQAVVLPPGTNGEALMHLGAKRLSLLFQNDNERMARAGQEGNQWTIAGDDADAEQERRFDVGRELFKALRQEQQHALDQQNPLRNGAHTRDSLEALQMAE